MLGTFLQKLKRTFCFYILEKHIKVCVYFYIVKVTELTTDFEEKSLKHVRNIRKKGLMQSKTVNNSNYAIGETKILKKSNVTNFISINASYSEI